MTSICKASSGFDVLPSRMARAGIVIGLVVAGLAGCGKEPSSSSEAPAPSSGTREVPKPSTNEAPKVGDLAARASAEVPALEKLGKRALTSADIDRYLAIEAELAPHKPRASDPKTVAAYREVADPIFKKHGLSGSLEHTTIHSRLKVASMHLKLNVADAKLDPIQLGDREAVRGRLADLKGKI